MIITIEGGDQAGKKTQSQLLAKAISKKFKTKIYSFPDYNTPIGKEIDLYLHGKRKFAPQVIHCLLAANRWEKARDIQKFNSKKSVLIMNRYYESNLVYGSVNGLSIKWLQNLDAGLARSDLVIVLDVPQKESFRRKKAKRDVFEKNKTFSLKILKTYRQLSKKFGWKIIDASKPKSEVHQAILKTVSAKLRL